LTNNSVNFRLCLGLYLGILGGGQKIRGDNGNSLIGGTLNATLPKPNTIYRVGTSFTTDDERDEEET
jgi:hypothetical protein